MTSPWPQLGLLIFFFLGLLWSLRDLGVGHAAVITLSVIGAFIYLLITTEFTRVVDASHRATTVQRLAALLLAFLALACVNMAVWAVLVFVATRS